MSLLFPDTLSLFVSPSQVLAVKTAGRTGRLLDMQSQATAASAEDDWQGLANSCAELGALTKVRRLRIVLSDQLVRYACFPWSNALRNAKEDLAFARLGFDDVHGAGHSEAWHFGFSQARPGQGRLAVAMPLSLVKRLRNGFAGMLPTPCSLSTSFATVLHGFRRQLPQQAWLLHLEGERLTLGSWDAGGWKRVLSTHAALHSAAALRQRLQQELALANHSPVGDQPTPVYVHAPALLDQALGEVEGLRLLQLRPAHPDYSADCAFGLPGAGA